MGDMLVKLYDLDFSKIICPHLYMRIFPYMLFLEHGVNRDKFGKGIEVSCPIQKNIKYLIKDTAQACSDFNRLVNSKRKVFAILHATC